MEQDITKRFQQAYDDYADALFRHCYFRVHDREMAKDLVSETFCRTWVYLSQSKEIDNIRAFLYRVLHNVIVDELRKERSVSLEQIVEDGYSPKDESIKDPEERVLVQQVIDKLKFLDESYRTVAQMRFIDDLPPKDIAHALGVSENVVSVRLYRAIHKLKEMMDGKLPKLQ